MKPSLNRTTISKLIVHGIELHAAFEKKESKQKNAKLYFKKIELSFFSHKIAFTNAILWEKKDNSNLLNVYKHKGLVPMLQIKTFMGDFSSVYCSILSKMARTFLNDFL